MSEHLTLTPNHSVHGTAARLRFGLNLQGPV
jgi:hypothetical protein